MAGTKLYANIEIELDSSFRIEPDELEDILSELDENSSDDDIESAVHEYYSDQLMDIIMESINPYVTLSRYTIDKIRERLNERNPTPGQEVGCVTCGYTTCMCDQQ